VIGIGGWVWWVCWYGWFTTFATGQLHDMEHSFVFLITEASAVFYGICMLKWEPIDVSREWGGVALTKFLIASIEFFQYAIVFIRKY
jgi:hypothetical protein